LNALAAPQTVHSVPVRNNTATLGPVAGFTGDRRQAAPASMSNDRHTTVNPLRADEEAPAALKDVVLHAPSSAYSSEKGVHPVYGPEPRPPGAHPGKHGHHR
jgi:hypothetical protein